MTKKKRAERDALIVEHLDWARAIARQVAGMLPTWFTAEDLTGPAEIALVKTAEQYDPGRGIPFRPFAQRRIYGACFDSIRRREYQEHGHLQIEDVIVIAGAPGPEQQAISGQQRGVWAIVQRLPSRHAVVILAVYGGGMTLESLAEMVGVRASRLSQIHREALRMLKKDCETSGLAA